MNDGKHNARAVEWGLGQAKSGAEQIAIKFQLIDSDETITEYLSFSDKAYEYTIKKMRTCGWAGDDLTALDSLGANEVQLVIETEEYPAGSGKHHQRVKFINDLGGGQLLKTKLDDASVRAFAAKMKSKINALGIVPPAKTNGNLPPF